MKTISQVLEHYDRLASGKEVYDEEAGQVWNETLELTDDLVVPTKDNWFSYLKPDEDSWLRENGHVKTLKGGTEKLLKSKLDQNYKVSKSIIGTCLELGISLRENGEWKGKTQLQNEIKEAKTGTSNKKTKEQLAKEKAEWIVNNWDELMNQTEVHSILELIV